MGTVRFSFIDLFAGIGGIRIAMESAGGRCVFSSEIDRFAQTSYRHLFPNDTHKLVGDITKVASEDIPDFDVLTGGFPCQPFSIAGVSKKESLGRAHGFDDPEKGNLFFEIERILHDKRPRGFLLENVRNLVSHNKGQTFQIIREKLTNAGYVFSWRIINAKSVVAQSRNRIYLVGIRADLAGEARPGFVEAGNFWRGVETRMERAAVAEAKRYGLSSSESWPSLAAVLEPEVTVPEKYVITPRLWEYLQEYKRTHRKKGNGFGFLLVTRKDSHTGTISARYYKDGADALVCRGENERPRRLTPYETGRLQGFPEEYLKHFSRSLPQPVSDVQAYKQFGNSVSVPVVSAIAQEFAIALDDPMSFLCDQKLVLSLVSPQTND